MEIYCIKNPKQSTLHHMDKVLKYCLATAAMLLLTITVHAQSSLISLNLRDTTIEFAINEIRNQTDASFIYNHEELNSVPKVSIAVDKVTIEVALDILLNNTGLTYEKVNTTIVIKPIKKADVELPYNSMVFRQTVRGQVFDKDSKVELPYATVQILNTTPSVGTTTDSEGKFSISNLPVGRYTIKVSFVGYTDAYLPEIVLGSAKETIVKIELTEQVRALNEVVFIGANGEPINEMAIVSAKAFDAEETKRYAATFGDPARMAQVFAGVSGTDDVTNEIVVRGNSPNWLQWKLEGVEIPNPNHFAEEGYNSGAVSILSVNMLGNSDFYTGAFPAEYGNALSGVFDLNLRNGNNQENEFIFQLGVLGVDLSAEGPFKKGYDGSFLFNYRYSTFSLLSDLNIQVSDNSTVDYQDLSFKFNLPTKNAGTFSLWGIGGLSEAGDIVAPDSLLNETYKDGYTDFTSGGMYATGLSHTYFTGKDSHVHSVISMSSSFSSQNYEEMDSLNEYHGTFFDDLENRAIRFSSYYNKKYSSKLSFRTGIVLNGLNYNYYTRSYIDSTQTWNTYLDSKGNTGLYQAYIQSKYKFSDNVILTTGLNYSHFTLSSDNSIEPRLGLLIGLPNQQKLGFGYGKHSKHEQLPVYFVENKLDDGSVYMPNISLELSRAHHFVASYEKLINDELLFKTEAYYQYMGNLPVPTNPDKYWSPIFGGVIPDDTLANIGKGRNYGLELTIQKYFNNSYYFLVTSSLFDSKYKPADGKWHNTRYNINFINNFVGGKEFKWGDNKMVGLNAKIIWSGGKRQTPIDLDASIAEGETVYVDSEIFSTQSKDYFRIDLGFRLHFYKLKSEHVLSLEIQNVTNRLNTWIQSYDAENQSIVDDPMVGMIPILNYRIEF